MDWRTHRMQTDGIIRQIVRRRSSASSCRQFVIRGHGHHCRYYGNPCVPRAFSNPAPAGSLAGPLSSPSHRAIATELVNVCAVLSCATPVSRPLAWRRCPGALWPHRVVVMCARPEIGFSTATALRPYAAPGRRPGRRGARGGVPREKAAAWRCTCRRSWSRSSSSRSIFFRGVSRSRRQRFRS